jgi:hypothetical protein
MGTFSDREEHFDHNVGVAAASSDGVVKVRNRNESAHHIKVI